MKALIVAFLLIVSLVQLSFAQISPKIREFDMWLSRTNSAPVIKGYLYELKSTSILTAEPFPQEVAPHYRIDEFSIEQIEKIQFRKQGKLGKYIILGTVIGTALGVKIGKMDRPDCDAANSMCTSTNTKAILGGMLLGAGVGTFIGIQKITIPLNGKGDNYNVQRLLKYQLSER
ncbi:hypothetical protein [Echinicola sediminis]